MKKYYYIVICLIIIVSISGCASTLDNVSAAPTDTFATAAVNPTIALTSAAGDSALPATSSPSITSPIAYPDYAYLSDYPQDILPLYKNIGIHRSCYTVMYNPDPYMNYDMSRPYEYSIAFYSSATPGEVREFYTGLYDRTSEDGIGGYIGNNKVSASSDINGLGAYVELNISMPKKGKLVPNQYFTLYPNPDTLSGFAKNFGSSVKLISQTYQRFVLESDRLEYFRAVYEEHLSPDEFKKIADKYQDFMEWEYRETDHYSSFSFSKDGYSWYTSCAKPNREQYMRLSVVPIGQKDR